MNGTLQLDLDKHFAKAEPVQPVFVENAAGVIIGGVLVVRGEREFKIALSLFPTAAKEPALPDLPKSETT